VGCSWSELADEVERRRERVVALFPLGGADLARVRGTYWAALILRTSSPALRPTPSQVISITCMTPCGSMTNVARSARPAPGRITPKLLVITPAGSPIIGNRILPIVSEVSCHALWVKWVSVDTEYTSTPIAWRSA
jgi:hypothetical protein